TLTLLVYHVLHTLLVFKHASSHLRFSPFFYPHTPPPATHTSFPTRRSSDLRGRFRHRCRRPAQTRGEAGIRRGRVPQAGSGEVVTGPIDSSVRVRSWAPFSGTGVRCAAGRGRSPSERRIPPRGTGAASRSRSRTHTGCRERRTGTWSCDAPGGSGTRGRRSSAATRTAPGRAQE